MGRGKRARFSYWCSEFVGVMHAVMELTPLLPASYLLFSSSSRRGEDLFGLHILCQHKINSSSYDAKFKGCDNTNHEAITGDTRGSFLTRQPRSPPSGAGVASSRGFRAEEEEAENLWEERVLESRRDLNLSSIILYFQALAYVVSNCLLSQVFFQVLYPSPPSSF